jgi:hypothetical protein
LRLRKHVEILIYMKPEHKPGGAAPSPEEVRSTSEDFRASPQLVAFLTFVVEAALSGEGGRVKAYTIGVEAFGRGSSFDPQVDPIVRVEATRLRRTLKRYYAGAGMSDPVAPLAACVSFARVVTSATTCRTDQWSR